MEKKTIYFEGQETNYEVSSDGRVFNKKFNRELKGTIKRNEYHSVQLMINGKPKTFMTHRLVAEAFCENPNNYTIVDHIDRNKLNNNYTNLRWVDNSTNVKNSDKKANHSSSYWNDNFDGVEIFDNYLINKKGTIINKNNNRILKCFERNGYQRIRIGSKAYSIHLLVWENFNGKIPEGMVLDHINGNRSDNRLENLRLVSQSENIKNAYLNGHSNKVSVSQYDKNGNFINIYSSFREAASAINGSECAIKDASNRHGTSGGYFWIRNDENITIEEVLEITSSGKPKSNYKSVSQYDKNGNFIKHYESMGEAARAVSCSLNTIKRAAENKRLGAGYYWILDNQNITIHDLCPENSLNAG